MFLSRVTPGPSGAALRRRDDATKLATFAAIGVVCTVAFALLFSALRHVTGPIGSNIGAYTATVGLNFTANRRLTFRAQDGDLKTQAAGYGAVYLFGLGASSVALWAALELFGHPAGRAELVLALAAGVFATVLRYLMLNRWVFVEPARG